jgi:hypothetical protein
VMSCSHLLESLHFFSHPYPSSLFQLFISCKESDFVHCSLSCPAFLSLHSSFMNPMNPGSPNSDVALDPHHHLDPRFPFTSFFIKSNKS